MTRRPSHVAALCTFALLLSAYCGSTMHLPFALADDAPPPPTKHSNAKRPAPDPNKAKPGEHCKTDSDCDRVNAQCLPAGDHKQCTLVPPKDKVGPVVPVVT